MLLFFFILIVAVFFVSHPSPRFASGETSSNIHLGSSAVSHFDAKDAASQPSSELSSRLATTENHLAALSCSLDSRLQTTVRLRTRTDYVNKDRVRASKLRLPLCHRFLLTAEDVVDESFEIVIIVVVVIVIASFVVIVVVIIIPKIKIDVVVVVVIVIVVICGSGCGWSCRYRSLSSGYLCTECINRFRRVIGTLGYRTGQRQSQRQAADNCQHRHRLHGSESRNRKKTIQITHSSFA